MLLDRFNELMGLFKNKKTRSVRVISSALYFIERHAVTIPLSFRINCDYITFLLALSPSSLARLRNSAYFMESKSIFDARWSDFI